MKKLNLMKKAIVSCSIALLCLLPAIPQAIDEEVDEEVPVKAVILKKDQIPAEVQKSVGKDFTYGEPIQWSNFPYLFQKYGWSIANNGDETIQPDRYDVMIKSKNGGTLNAVYSADGKLLRSREVLKNGPLPLAVEKSINQSEYKDWRIQADKELIQDFENNGLKHYIVRVENGDEKKALYFDEQGNLMAKKKVLNKELKNEKKELKKEERKEVVQEEELEKP
jgi:hypothetical protein